MTTGLSPFILHVDSGKEWRGGQAQVLELMRGLRTGGWSQTLACPPQSPLGKKAHAEGFDVETITMRGEWDFFAPGKIARLARRRKAELIHAHASQAHGLAWRALKKLPDTPLLVTRRVDFPIAINGVSRGKYLNSATHYIAISSAVSEVLLTGGVSPARIDIVPSGINPSRFTNKHSKQDLARRYRLPDDTFIICNIGALTDHKGHKYLIEAARLVLATYSKARFFIVGEGELHAELEHQIANHGLQGEVFLTGFVEDVEPFLAGMDVCAVSSHLEGLGTSMLDAMYFGKPVVASSAGGTPDAIDHGRSGLLVEPKNPQALARGIMELLSDPLKRKRYGEAARLKVVGRFTAEKMARGTEAVYRRILSEARSQHDD